MINNDQQWSYPQEGGCRDATGIFRDGGMAQYCRVPSEQVRLFGDYVESPQNRSVGLVVWWSPVYVCIIGRAVSFVFSDAGSSL